jgi:hypothetical protein
MYSTKHESGVPLTKLLNLMPASVVRSVGFQFVQHVKRKCSGPSLPSSADKMESIRAKDHIYMSQDIGKGFETPVHLVRRFS